MFTVAARYGLGIAFFLIAYFILAKLLGLHQYPVFSAFNGVIFGVGIFVAMRKFKRNSDNFKYEHGFQAGFFTGAIATFIFSAFMAVYIFMLDTQFAQAILDSWNLNYNKGSLMLVISLIIMGLSTTLVLTLAFMQLLKESWNTSRLV
ncbi:MAG: DUF4199 domain-containing protein [Bacteroidota bacterium]